MDTMTRFGGLTDVEADLQREVDAVADRFPDVDRAVIDAGIRQTYQSLAATATIRSHLAVIAGAFCASALRRNGAVFQPRSAA
jgi:hypothetical protein